MEKTMFEKSSGNVFADLGFDDADEMLMRGKIGIQVLYFVWKFPLAPEKRVVF